MGILFTGFLIHEGVHIYQSKNPVKVCYHLQDKYWMSVEHAFENYEEYEEFGTFQRYTEKWASLIQELSYILLGSVITLAIVYIWRLKNE